MHVQACTCQVKQAENLLCDSGCPMGCTTTSTEMSCVLWIREQIAVPG